MKKSVLSFLFLVISQYSFAQFTEVFSNTGTLTTHWKKLGKPALPAFLKGSYYFKLDDNSFVATDGTVAGTKKLDGFGNIKNITHYFATSRYLYYLVYTGGKGSLTRYDPVTGVHANVMNGIYYFTVEDAASLVFSVFENKIVVSSWLLASKGNTTITYLYAIHDVDPVPVVYTLAGSTDEVGISYGPVGLSDDEVSALYDLKKSGGDPPNKVLYVFAFKDSVSKGYLLKKEYDFGKIGLEIRSLMGAGKDVLLLLEDKKKKAEKKPNFSSIWRLRNKTTTKLADLPEIKATSYSSTYQSGDWLFMLFKEAIYSYNTKTGLLRSEMGLNDNEIYGYLTSGDYVYSNGDMAWFRIGTRQPGGTVSYRIEMLNLVTHKISHPAVNLPSRFTTNIMYDLTELQYPHFSANYIYYFDGFTASGAQLFQQSLQGGEVKKIVLPKNAAGSFVQFTGVTQVGGMLVLKGEFKAKKTQVVKSFFYRLP